MLSLFVLSAGAQTTTTKPKKTTPTTTTKPATITNKAVNVSTKATNAVNGANNAVNNASASVNNAASNVNTRYNKANNTVNKILSFGSTDSSKTVTTAVIAPPPGPPGRPSDTLMQNLKKLGSLFKKPRITVTIKVPGANRAKLKELCELVKTCPNIDKKGVDFDDAQQNITVSSYKGKVNDLLSDIQKRNTSGTVTNSSSSPTDNSITINP